jgi:hypothetical protein
LTVIGVIVIAFGVLYVIALVRSTVKLRRAYAALEADGRPMRAADVIPPEVPDTQNAAVLYQSAALMLKGQAAGDKNLLERLGRLSDAIFQRPDDPDKIAQRQQEMTELRQRMSEPVVASALAAVEQGTQRPACQFDREYGGGLSNHMPFEQDLRNLIRVLGTRACLEAASGQVPQAWTTVQTQLKFADALRSDPVTMSQWTRLGMIGYSSRIIQAMCETAPPDAETAQKIDARLKDLADITPLVRALDGERLLIGEWLFNLPGEELDKLLRKDIFRKNNSTPEALQKVLYQLGFRILAFKPRLVADHAAYLNVMRVRVELLQDSSYLSPTDSRKLLNPTTWDALTSRLTNWTVGDKWVHARRAADLQMTRAGLALLQYKQAHGQFPPTLDALGLDGLIDPYTGKPLLYRPEGEGFVVYSVGEDLKDNGGTPRPERQDPDPRHRKPVEYDLVWRFPNPANRILAGNP